jgi:hypothetical protein
LFDRTLVHLPDGGIFVHATAGFGPVEAGSGIVHAEPQ